MNNLILKNIEEETVIGVYPVTIQFVDAVRKIRNNGPSWFCSIKNEIDAKNYLKENHPELSLEEIEIVDKDVEDVIRGLGYLNPRKDLVDYVLYNYSPEDDTTSNWREIVESLVYQFINEYYTQN